jgi:endonuclease VIII
VPYCADRLRVGAFDFIDNGVVMPEGPEIFIAAKQIHSAVANQPIKLTLHYPSLAGKAKALKGAKISKVSARSKALLTEFNNGIVLYSHNQLYGQWVVHTLTEPNLNRQARLIIQTNDRRVVLYSATDFAWLTTENMHLHPYLAKLGPEVLSDSVTAHMISQRLLQFPRQVVAQALLNQQVLAGLGNYLRADILFVAGISPTKKIGELCAHKLSRLAKACKTLPLRSVKQAGVIRPLAQYRLSRKKGLDYEQARFYVFDREDQPCWHCGFTIARITQGGRGLFFCPACQS